MNRRPIAVFALLGAPFLLACIWDRDTLQMERSRFPSALELITGKFRRHSPEYYQWRIADRLAKLETDPTSLPLLDDLAVAYEKTGDTAKAIEIMERKEQLAPGKYETAANLGTFFVHAGDLESGLKWIRRAIEINPDAHFGREVVQQHVVEFLIDRRVEFPPTLPLSSYSPNFVDFLREKMGTERRLEAEGELLRRINHGLLGMVRFGNSDSPVLLELLGDALNAGRWPEDSSRLATRCYLKASYQTRGTPAEAKYRQLAKDGLGVQKNATFSDLETRFGVELADAASWYTELRENELRWIAEGGDVDAKYDAEYYADPVSVTTIEWPSWMKLLSPWYVVPLLGVVVTLYLSLRRRRTRSLRQ